MESPRAAPGIGPGLEDWRCPGLGEFKKKTPCCLEVGVRNGGRDVEEGTPSVDKLVYAVWVESLHDQVIDCALDLDRFPVPQVSGSSDLCFERIQFSGEEGQDGVVWESRERIREC